MHVDTEQAGEKLVNRRLAYVAISRGRYDAQIYTNDKSHLAEQLSREVSRPFAIESSPGCTLKPSIGQKTERAAPSQAAEQSVDRGLSMGR
jgi:hypothetical protein